jgi:hypothetical protein
MGKSTFAGGFDNDAIREARDAVKAMNSASSVRRETIRNLKAIIALQVVVAVMLVTILAKRLGLL